MSEAQFIPRWARNIRFSPTGHITQADTQTAVAGLDTRVYALESAGGGTGASIPDLYLVTDPAYGAVGDGKNVQSGAITAGSNVLNIGVRTTTPPARAPWWNPPNYESQFSFLDIGKPIILTGAGAGGGWLKTTITGVNSTTQVTLAASASTTITIDMPVSWGTDNTAAFQLCINDVVQTKRAGTIGVPISKYFFLGHLVWPVQDLVNGGTIGGGIQFMGICSGIPELYSYRDVTAPILMITDEVNDFLQFPFYPAATYGTLNSVWTSAVTVSNLVFYHPNQIKVTGTTASSTPLTYPWTVNVARYNMNISFRDCLFVNSFKAMFWASTRGNLNNLKIGAFNLGIEIDGIYDFAFIENIEILPAFAAFIEGLWAGAATNIEHNYCINNLYGMKIKYCDALSIKGFGMFFGYAGILLSQSASGAGYGNISDVHIDSVYHGIIEEATKGPGWSIVNYTAEIFSYAGTSAIWVKDAASYNGFISWTGGGYYCSANNPIKIDPTINGVALRVSGVNNVVDMMVGIGNQASSDRIKLGIGTIAPTQALDVRGKIRIGNDSVFTSLGGGELRYGNSAGIFEGYNTTAGVWEKISVYGDTLLTVNSTTPGITGGNGFYTANTSATSITNFTGGFDGQEITITFTDVNTTIVNGATIKLAGAVDFVATADDILTLKYRSGVWREKSRSVN